MYEGPMYEIDNKKWAGKIAVINSNEYDIAVNSKTVAYTEITGSRLDAIIKAQKKLIEAYKYAIMGE